MKSKWAQSIRLLRFSDVRVITTMFSHYLRRFIIGSAILILPRALYHYICSGNKRHYFPYVIAGGAIVAYAGTPLARKVKASGG